MLRFYLVQPEGIKPVLAEGVVFYSGRVVLNWIDPPESEVSVFESTELLEAISGARDLEISWVDQPVDWPANIALAINDLDLTPAQKSVVYYVLSGLPTREIAEKLFLSEQTVKNHLTAVYDLLGLRNRIELINLIARRSYRLANTP